MAIYSRDLSNTVGLYYNSKTSYYEILEKIIDFPNTHIWNKDTAINTLKEGYRAVRCGKEISYDGLNFIIKEK